CALACHALPIERKATCVAACVLAVMRSWSRAERYTTFEPRHERTASTLEREAAEARWLILTRGWPRGSTLGPWREWQEMISASGGSQRSKALISGSLQEVWPPTIAPTLVAAQLVRDQSS